MFSGTAAMTRPVRGGKLLALATTGTKSNGALPDVPSFAEAGLDVEISLFWHAVVAPQGWPKRVASPLQFPILATFSSKDVVQRLAADGIEVAKRGPAGLLELIMGDIARWPSVAEGIDLMRK